MSKLNTSIVRSLKVFAVQRDLPESLRAELEESVRQGNLEQIKREGDYPEVFFHPDHLGMAIRVRDSVGCLAQKI